MPNWPPDPNKRPDNSANQPTPMQQPNAPSGQEWKVLENTLLASVVEQRRARRWSIFFKLLTFGYILLIFLTIGRGCSGSPTGMDAVDTSSPHLAVVELQGVISNDDVANAYDVNEALTDAFAN
ncbi:MAG TPA: S49 family peptidase, partial [Psychrobacter sp.]|nr:S49 family peptidase [Psychrobacter sp.]